MKNILHDMALKGGMVARNLALAAVLAWASSFAGAAAQVIEFEPPEEIEVDTSRLIVTFEDSASAAQAEAVVRDVGVNVLERTFHPVVVWGLAPDIPDADGLIALRQDERVRDVEVRPPSASAGIWIVHDDGTQATADFSTHGLRVELASETPQDVARGIVEAQLPDVPLRMEKRPNEITIEMPADRDEDEVVAALESHALVRYVTFFSLNDPALEE